MSLASYSDLQTQLANWLGRSDLTSYIPDFITLFEASAARRLKVRPAQVSTTLTPSGGTVALPADFLTVRRLSWEGSTPAELTYAPPGYLKALFPTNPTGTPRLYTIEAANILVRPSDDSDLSLLYNAKTAALSSALNWLMSSHPDAYLFGSLAEAEGFQVNPEQMAIWKARRDEIFEEILALNFSDRADMSVRVMGATP